MQEEVHLSGMNNIRVKLGDVYIMPSSDKLVFTPIKPDEGVFKIIEETSLSIFQNLKHTPIVAIGTNFTVITWF